MTLSRTARALLAGVAALIALPAAAQSPGFGPGYGMMQGYGPGYGMMQGYGPGYGMGFMQPGRGRHILNDADGDGVVSAEEAASAADEVFTAMDADDDGVVTSDEYMAQRLGPQWGRNPDRQAAMQQAKADRFAEMDADGDGSVSKKEFLDAAKSHHEAADEDGDGTVSPWEFRHRNWN